MLLCRHAGQKTDLDFTWKLKNAALKVMVKRHGHLWTFEQQKKNAPLFTG